ncbi:hypothetical protein FGO68_gene17669 [Halteria grandinella]|uniref:Uncharacterized protein n=1 Tax=Halteria grandinella TaxID=5974 RepID=A0A8J8P3B2_HALGN|nr:hypothetical protein FGO68_gene17669 [Halteria grandinella]
MACSRRLKYISRTSKVLTCPQFRTFQLVNLLRHIDDDSISFKYAELFNLEVHNYNQNAYMLASLQFGYLRHPKVRPSVGATAMEESELQKLHVD